MMFDKSRAIYGWSKAVLPFVLALICSFCIMAFPAKAFAYFSLAPVSIDFGTSYLTMDAGSSNSVYVSLNPLSERQLPGCGMSVCPEACNGMANPTTGVVGGCLNSAGWCTCAGTTYYTANTQSSVSSSNPYVARASINGSSLNIQAYSAGTTTITVYASLEKHVDNAASMTVQVNDVVNTPSSGSSESSANNSGVSASSGSEASSSSGSGSAASAGISTGSSAVTVDSASSVAVSSTGVPAAVTTVAASEEKNESVVEAADGTKVLIVQANSAAKCSEELAKIAGTDGSCTFWTGTSSDKPDISWTFKGRDLDPAGNLNMDLGVTVSEKGTGTVADVLSDAKDSLVMDWKHGGALPGKASVYVRTSGKYADGTSLSLYCFDDSAQRFELVKTGITTANGYASFDMDHCSTWALSADDLTAYAASAVESGVEDDIAKVNTEGASNGFPWAVAVGCVVALFAVVAIVAAMQVRKKRGRAVEPDVVGADAAGRDDDSGGPDAAAGEGGSAVDGSDAGN